MKPILVTTSWDDGHKLDVRLAALLEKYAIKGTFYIAPKDKESAPEDRLTDQQIAKLGESFEIGAHTMTHAELLKISDEEARKEIVDSREYLQKLTGQTITSFCYPRGEYQKQHVKMLAQAGFKYARTIKRHTLSLERPLEATTTVNTYNHYSDLWKIARFARFNPLKTIRYFQWDNLAKAMFDDALETGGIYHLWGHSWEIEEHGDWEKLESVLAYIAHRKNALYVNNNQLEALESKKVFIAIPYFPPHLGGTQMYAFNIAKRFERDPRWDVRVIASGGVGFRIKKEVYEGITVYRLPYWFKLSNTPINPWWPVMMRKIINREKPVVINAHAPVPFMSDVVAIVKGKTPLVMTYHTGSMRKTSGGPANILIWLYEHGPLYFLLHRAKIIVCPSDFVRFGFLKAYIYKSTTITPAVDTSVFFPAPEKSDFPTVLFVGGLTRSEQHKGLKVLLNAFQILHKTKPDVHLVVGGDGNMREEYKDYAKKLGLQEIITFTGRLTTPDLVVAYRKADIFILPSLAPAESFGMVLVEAMASGKPVIGSRAGGIPLVIDHEKTGLLVDSNNPEAIVDAITRLLDNPGFAKQLADAGLEKVKRQYIWDMKAEAYASLFEKILLDQPTVAQIVGYYPPHVGGMEIVAQQISLNLADRGYSVRVLTSNGGAEKGINDNETNYRVIRMLKSEIAHTPILWSLPFHLLALPKKSIVHVHISQAGIPEVSLLIAKFKDLRFVAHFHLDVPATGSMGILLPLYKKYFLGQILRKADIVIVFSEEQVKIVSDLYKVKKSNIVIIPNGVSQAFFNENKNEGASNHLRLLYVGRLNGQKRVERLLEAMAKIKIPAHLTIVGDGEDRGKLEALATQLKLANVSFEGKKYGDELRSYYQNADVLLTASDNEGMSLVALEAMASGLPIIGSDVPGTRELITGVGILVGSPYPENFASAITDLWNNPERLKILSAQSVAKAKLYTWDTLIEKLERIYKEIEK